MRRAAAALLFIGLAGCPRPVPPPARPDGSDAAIQIGTCAGVCQNGRRLGCAFAQPTPAGGACEDVCRNAQASGIVMWDLACRSTAASCAAVDACR